MKYFERRKKAKLYKQWVEKAGLPSAGLPSEEVTPKPDKSHDILTQITKQESNGSIASGPVQVLPSSSAVTHAAVTGDMMAEIDKRRPRLRILYIILGVSIVILCGALVLLSVQSC